MRTRLPLMALLVALLASPAALAQDEPAELSLTIYSNADPHEFDPQRFIAQQRAGRGPTFAYEVPGFAVIRARQAMDFQEGLNELQLTDVAQFIDPTTVSFIDMEAPDATSVIEQQFEFDLASPDKLLERYIDQQVTLTVPAGDGAREQVTGSLISMTGNQLVLQTDAGLQMIPHGDDVHVVLDALPEGIVTKPTLSWLVHSAEAGQRDVRTSYQTDGLTWQADYNLVLNDDESAADLAAWVTLLNLSGAAYDDAQLKLIAGEVQRIERPRPRRPRVAEDMMMRAATAEAAAGFEQEAFFEYHLYTLPRRTDVPSNATKQLALFPTAADVPVEKVLVFEASQQNNQRNGFGAGAGSSIDVYIRFDNQEQENLGMPLPRGKVRVYKEDPNDAGLEFIGEDLIDHTPRNEEVFVKVGRAFDVVAERTRTRHDRDTDRRTLVESYEVTIRNQKEDEDETVIVREQLRPWLTAEITDASHEPEHVDAHTVHFEADVPAGEEATVTYTIRYTW